MAFKMKSPLLNKEKEKTSDYSSYVNPQANSGLVGTGISDEKTITNTNADGSDSEVDISKSKTALDVVDDERAEHAAGGGYNQFLKERIDVARNPRQKARLKGKLARKEERQEESASRKNLRNFGNEQGLTEQELQDQQADIAASDLDQKWKMVEAEGNINKLLNKTDISTSPTPIDKVNEERNQEQLTPVKMTNRAGRHPNSGYLITDDNNPAAPKYRSVRGEASAARFSNIASSAGSALHQNEGVKPVIGAGDVQDLSIQKPGVSKGRPYGIHTADPSAKPKDPNPQNLDRPTEFIKPGLETFKSNIKTIGKSILEDPTGIKRALSVGATSGAAQKAMNVPKEKKTYIETPYSPGSLSDLTENRSKYSEATRAKAESERIKHNFPPARSFSKYKEKIGPSGPPQNK